jgi:hypothetical protein
MSDLQVTEVIAYLCISSNPDAGIPLYTKKNESKGPDKAW